MVTAAVADSPPVLQWDRVDDRNQLSWYLHHPLDAATAWSLQPHTIVRVTGICYGPHLMREDVFPPAERCGTHGPQLHLLLEGCRENRVRFSPTGGQQIGGGLFPSLLRGELHEVRATIEHHAKTAEVTGVAEATACGWVLQGRNFGAPAVVLVTAASGAVTRYRIDRWD